jgi:hypothetical protein
VGIRHWTCMALTARGLPAPSHRKENQPKAI